MKRAQSMNTTQQKINHKIGVEECRQNQVHSMQQQEETCNSQVKDKSYSMKKNDQESSKPTDNPTTTESCMNCPKSKCGSTSIILIFMTAMLLINSLISVGTNYMFSRNRTQSDRIGIDTDPALVSSVAPTPDATTNVTTVPPSLDILTEGWINFDFPKFVYQFAYNDLEEVVISFESIIPTSTQANYVKFIVLQKACEQPGWNEYFTRVRSVNGKNVYVHWLHNIASNACYSTAQTFIIPTSQSREIRIKGYNKRVKAMYAKFYITAHHP